MAREPEAVVGLRRALGERLAIFRQAAELTQGQLADATICDRTNVVHIEKGRNRGDERFWSKADEVCNADGVLLAGFHEVEAAKAEYEHDVRVRELADVQARADRIRTPVAAAGLVAASSWLATPQPNDSDEQDALELVRRVAASDVGNETLTRLEAVVDELAIAYSKTPPTALLGRIRQHLGYVNRLLDARKTLNEHRRLLVLGGWLSLLAATVHIDLKQQAAASARLKTAASLARHAVHDEIHAWCFETEAWRML
ncbi:MAG TPA: helix-turn-helix transcriptional regulator, partial [Pseudonocardiaceae bacterium]